MQIIFLSDTKYLGLAQYVNTFLVRHQKFGTAQNILRPVKGQGINFIMVLLSISFDKLPCVNQRIPSYI